ncbi:MAG: 3-hydroxybutyryl-CoA dehydrogenase [Alphaproteobacteria bacterium]|nr:3-hydroxybutyryl-CoA dehydrogenase [Alphaproteobacteria bacterium]
MKIEQVAVVGAGQMGNGIAHVSALAGYKVILIDVNQDALDNGLAAIEKNMARQVSKDKISQADMDVALTNIVGHTNMAGLGDIDLLIEAVAENFELKVKIFNEAQSHVKADCLFASNTSSLSITKLATATDRAERFIGLHFMNPVPMMKLVELISGLATSDEMFGTSKKFAESLGKTVATAEDFPGFIANRILMPMINEAIYTLYEGVGSAEAIDTVMKLGMAHKMGPLELADYIGLDTCLAIMNVLHDGFGDGKYRACPLLVKYVDAGWLGVKTGHGFYNY